jgi:ParB-like chromosome segregation protein Spo0J
MGPNAGRLSCAESERRVALNVDPGELARAVEALDLPPIVAHGGVTIAELAADTGRPYNTISDRLRALVRAGKAEIIGRRPGSNGAQVYRIL